MFDSGLHITTLLSASWLPWVCLAMMVLLWLSCMMQPRYLHGLISNSFATFTVNAAEQAPSVGSQITQWLFNTIVPAICIYTLVTQTAVYGTDLFGTILLLSLLTDVFRAVTAIAVQYTFRFGKLAGLAYMRYFSLRSLFTFVELMLVLLIAYADHTTFWVATMGIMTVVYLVILGLQWGRLFCTSVLDIVSLIIYLLTIELLPTALLYEAGKQLYL